MARNTKEGIEIIERLFAKGVNLLKSFRHRKRFASLLQRCKTPFCFKKGATIMKNKLKTTPNQAVQIFITYGNQKGDRQLKEERLQQLEETLAAQGIYSGGKVHRVLEKLIYDFTYNGIIKVSREHLSNKLEVGFNTISTAFKYMEQSKLFILSRNKSGKTNSGCRVIIDAQHVNFESILK